MEDSIQVYIEENPYEYGIVKHDEHILQEDKNLPVGKMKNPFFINCYRKFSDLNKKNVYEHKRIIIVCLKNNYNNLSSLLFDYGVNQTDFMNYCHANLTYVIGSLKLLSNKTFRNLLIIMKQEDLQLVIKDVPFEKTELVIPMFESTHQYVEKFVSLYNEKDMMKELINTASMVNYFENETFNLSSMFSEVKKNQFWCNKENCNVQCTEEFNKRNFRVIPEYKATSYHITENTYKFSDIGYAIKTSTNRKYYIPREKNNVSFSQVEQLFNVSSEKYLYDLLNSFLTSKEYCHLILNKNILERMTPIIEKYKPIYKYLFGYTWLYLYIEECLQRTYIKREDRFVIPLDVACKLPQFPFSYEDILQNPYIAFTVDKKNYLVTDNFLSVYPIHNVGGVCDFTEFKKRFNIFTSGKSNVDIFDGIDNNSFAMTGSMIPACVQKNPPRFLENTSKTTFDDAWNEYFSRCYNESDIDIMCNKPSIIEFCDCVSQFIAQIKKNVKELKVDYEKTVAISIHKAYITIIKNDINAFLGFTLTEDEIAERVKRNDEELRQYFVTEYVKQKSIFNKSIKNKSNEPIRKFALFTGTDNFYLKLIDYDRFEGTKDFDVTDYVHIFAKDIDPSIKHEQNKMLFKMSEGLKVDVTSPTNSFRKLQIWNIQQRTFDACVARFHLPCVRGYFHKDNVYLLPSCITALMTCINIDYKYFAGRKDPFDVFMKYRLRGFGIIVNKLELSDLKTKVGGFYTPIKLNKFGMDDKDVPYIMTNEDVKSKYDKSIQLINIFKFKAINDNGTINPYQDWIVEAFYKTLN
jgi:hypothetical protein